MSGLHVDSVIKQFGQHQLLSDIFLSCQKGEILGLLGRNGSGKSTLLQIIFGSMSAERRFVKVDNKVIRNGTANPGLISYLPQHSFLPDDVQVKHLLRHFSRKDFRCQLQKDPLIAPHLYQKCRELSTGHKRVIEILLILHSRASYVLLDEPFSGLAPVMKEEIKARIKAVSRKKGILLTDHSYQHILDIQSKLILLRDGCTRPVTSEKQLVEWGYLNEI